MITMGLWMLHVIARVVPCGLLCLVVCCATACEAFMVFTVHTRHAAAVCHSSTVLLASLS